MSLNPRYQVRNKSSGKVHSQGMFSGTGMPQQSNPQKNIQKNKNISSNQFGGNTIKSSGIKVSSVGGMKKSKEFRMEGDLNFSSPQQNIIQKAPNQRTNNIYNILNNKNVPIGSTMKNGNKGGKRLPAKSPLQIPNNYKANINYNFNRISNNNNIYPMNKGIPNRNFLMQSNNNNLHNNNSGSRANIHVSNNSSKPKGNSSTSKTSHRSLSPIARVKEQNKLSPNLVKTKYVSKSPLVNPPSFSSKFKKYHIVSSNSGSNYRAIVPKSFISHNMVKNDKHSSRPKSSNVVSNNGVLNRMNRQYDVSRDDKKEMNRTDIQFNKNKPTNNNANNSMNNLNNNLLNSVSSNQPHNIKIVKPEKEMNNNINNPNANNMVRQSNNIMNIPKENMQQMNNNNNPVNVNSILRASPESQEINQNIPLKNPNLFAPSYQQPQQVHQSINKIRSSSTSAPSKMEDFLKNKPMTGNKIISNKEPTPEPEPPVFQKKIKNIYQYTHVGYDGEADKENNQDIAFIEKNFAGNKDYIYMSVCDGHGVEGHYVSGYIKKILPKDLSRNLNHKDILNPNPQKKEEIHRIIRNTFIRANEKLVDNENINSTFSGSTCVSVIYTPTRLICPNIGDSRAVMGRYNAKTKIWTSQDLSRDHKPTDESEARRILENGGRIQPFIDEDTGEFVGPARVWVKEDEVPGLAMTRSFGDRVAASVGTISDPEILEFDLTEEDKFMLIASDGVWEFIPSQDCVNMIKKFYLENDAKGCCEYLYKESKMRWMKEEEVVDDITMILVFFE